MKKKYLITSALPYANGKLHIGHVAGAYLPADIFVRYLKLRQEDVVYVCGTDEHGTPISISADKEGITPLEVVTHYHESIRKSFEGLRVEFDNFSGTARPEHHALSQQFFLNLLEKGYISTKSTQQFYCEHDKRFLADRYVEGICPNCGAAGARGDQCDACGQVYETVTLKEPKCKICGNTPSIRETSHWFLELPKFVEKLNAFIDSRSYWKENVRNFMKNLLKEGMVERAITRDINWGVPVPLPGAEGKVLYVWFDAPIGYISSTVEWAKRIGQPDKWREYWLDPETIMVHFIGKDNIIFHSLMWPAMLMGQPETYVLPHDVPANEFMNLEGQKISTSRNWAIWVEDYLRYFEGDYLRYVMAANAPETKDADFSWKDFQLKVNAELNNVLGNLANRVFAFCNKQFEGMIPIAPISPAGEAVIAEAEATLQEIYQNYETYQVRKNTKLLIDLARLGNRYFDESKPWVSIKENRDAAAETMLVCANLLRYISVAMWPILPTSMETLRKMMGLDKDFNWTDCETRISSPLPLLDVKPLFRKIEDTEIEQQLKLLEANCAVQAPVEENPLKPEISFEDFEKMDLRLVHVLSAVKVPKADKLLQLKVRCDDKEIDVVSGIAKAYDPAYLVGKNIVMLMNLKPRKIMGILSQGMILSAESDGQLGLLTCERDLPDGSSIH